MRLQIYEKQTSQQKFRTDNTKIRKVEDTESRMQIFTTSIGYDVRPASISIIGRVKPEF